MANRKISDLTALTAPAVGDLLPIVDISEAAAASKNKRVTIQSLFQGIPVNVGIGTASPSELLELSATTDPKIQFTDVGNVISKIGISASTALTFEHNGSERARIDSSGRVGIGTASPSSILHLGAASGTIQMQFNNGGTSSYVGHDSAYAGLDIAAGGGIRFRTFNGSIFAEAAQIDSSNRLLVGGSTNSGGALLQVFGDRIRVGTAKTPASASATGTAGEICWDANYIYVCTATNTWKRTAIATW